MIDMASVYAERFKNDPRMLQAAVMGQSPDPKLDPYTALNALRLVKEASMMAMAGKAQQPTSQPSILADALTPPTPPQGMAGMPMGAPAGQMPPRPMPQGQPMPQPPVQQASGGLAGMPIPDHDYAGGGIVAFSGEDGDQLVRGLTVPPGTPFDPDETGAYLTDGTADPTVLATAQQRLKEYMDYSPKEMSAKEQEEFLDRYMARAEKAGGPNIYAPAREDLTARKEALAGDRRSGEGLALLTAAGAVLKGRNLAEGASNALPAFAQQLGEVKRAEQQEKRAIAQMNFALDDAQRKERMGDARGAQAALAEARKFQQDANRAQGEKLRYGADIAARTVQYSKTTGKGAGASGPKLNELAFQANVDNLLATSKPKPGESDTAFNARIRAQAADLTTKQVKTSFSSSLSDFPVGGPKAKGAEAAITSRENIEANKALDKYKFTNRRDWKKAIADAGSEQAAEDAYKRKWITNNPQSSGVINLD
jgi:hypothetical protein